MLKLFKNYNRYIPKKKWISQVLVKSDTNKNKFDKIYGIYGDEQLSVVMDEVGQIVNILKERGVEAIALKPEFKEYNK